MVIKTNLNLDLIKVNAPCRIEWPEKKGKILVTMYPNFSYGNNVIIWSFELVSNADVYCTTFIVNWTLIPPKKYLILGE